MKKNDETIGYILQDIRDVMDEMEEMGEEVLIARPEIEDIFDRIEQAYIRMGQKYAIELERAIDEVKRRHEKAGNESEH